MASLEPVALVIINGIVELVQARPQPRQKHRSVANNAADVTDPKSEEGKDGVGERWTINMLCILKHFYGRPFALFQFF